jgi:tetratricopeptide (TPR) repeat protein
MAGEDDTHGNDDETLGPDAADDETEFGEDAEEDAEEVEQAAASIEFVVLPIACTNEGRGAPLAMGVQRWWAQELAARGASAAAPVFTAMADQGGRKVPALMVFREPWTDERAKDGISRFPNAKKGLITDMRITETEVALTSRLVALEGDTLKDLEKWSWAEPTEKLPEKVFEMLRELTKAFEVELEHADWKAAFGTENVQSLTSFLVGLGNLSALQGRCVPTTPDQLLSPFMDAINRDQGMDAAMQGLHLMVDILVNNPFDQSAIPLSVQALGIAAQKRKNDKGAYHHLAMVFRRLGDVGSAVQAFNQAFNIDPTDDAITTQFIDTLRGAGDKANAMKVAQFAAERGNESPRLMARIGSLMIEEDQFDEAEPFLRRAIDEGKVPSAYGDLANVLWDRSENDQSSEDRKEALRLLTTAVEDTEGLAKTTLDMLLDLHEEDKNEEATKLLLQAAERFPENATVLRYVATMYLDGDDPEKARPYLERMLDLSRRSLDDDAFARRGRLQLDVDEFEDRYDDAIEKVRSGDAAGATEAARFLREIIAKDSRFWQPHLMLALAVRETEGDDAALGHLMDAVKLRPNDPEIRNLLAAILRKQGRPKEAVEHLRAVVALNPREVEPVVNLATAMRDGNMFDEARQVCQAALQMLPDHPEFKRILDGLPAPKEE